MTRRTPPDENIPLIVHVPFVSQRLGRAPLALADSAPAAASSVTDPAQPRWTEAGIRAELEKTPKGREILSHLPAGVQFRPWVRQPADKALALYKRTERVILIPTSYSSVEAAPTVAHEATHAYQWSAHGEPRDLEALIERDVEARNAGLDVYEQMGRPALPYNYAREADERAKDPVAYDQSVREWYREVYSR